MLRVAASPAWDFDGCSHRVVPIFLTAVGDYQTLYAAQQAAEAQLTSRARQFDNAATAHRRLTLGYP
jgi:hypothetical protein